LIDPELQQFSASDKVLNNYVNITEPCREQIYMPGVSPSQRIAEISKGLEDLRTHSLNDLDRGAKMLQDGLEQLQISLKELNALAGGGA
jgi:hypothetical protein